MIARSRGAVFAIVIKLFSVGYFIFLTMLLLAPQPQDLIGMQSGLPEWLRELRPYAHLMSFSVLAVLALAAHWPIPRWALALLLVGYGGATEILQGFVPPRTPAWGDWFQDVAGVATGFVMCGVGALVYDRILSGRKEPAMPVEGDR